MEPRAAADVMAADLAAYGAAAQAWHDERSEVRPLDAIRRFAAMAGRGARVIDVACGPAVDVRPLRDAGLVVVAGDRSESMMKVGGLMHPKRPLACWDLRRLPFADSAFAGVWAHGALGQLPRRGLRAALRELRRVHAAGPVFVSMRRGDGDLVEVTEEPAGTVHATMVSADELTALLLDQGYVRVEVDERPDPLDASATWLYGWGRLS